MSSKSPVAESIRHSIEKNGFPGKAVKLPFRPVYASCKQHGTPLAEVLTQLGEEGIIGTITGDHILFQTPELAVEVEEVSEKPGEPDESMTGTHPPVSSSSSFPGGLDNLAELAGNAMNQLSPEQIKSLKENFDAMSPEEKMKLIQFYGNLFSDPKNK